MDRMIPKIKCSPVIKHYQLFTSVRSRDPGRGAGLPAYTPRVQDLVAALRAHARAHGRGRGSGGIRATAPPLRPSGVPAGSGLRSRPRYPRRSASTPKWRLSKAQRSPNALYTTHRGRLIEVRLCPHLLPGQPLCRGYGLHWSGPLLAARTVDARAKDFAYVLLR